jgi:hypothetical protein
VQTDIARQRVREWHRKKYRSDPEWARRRNESTKRWVSEQRAKGLCTKCEALATHSTVCEEHFWKGRENNWKKRGIPITLAEFRQRYAAQDGKCALCCKLVSAVKIAVDHCHRQNHVRGLLCIPCNSAIGQLGDTAEALARAVTYLLHTKE